MNFLEATTFLALLLNIKTIVGYLILLLFLIDLAKADSYNKIARILKIILYPILLIMNIYYKKFNIGLLFAALLINGVTFYFILPGLSLGTIINFTFFETARALIGILKFVIIAGVILSWLYSFGASFYNSFTTLLQELYESTVSIFRNVIPPTGGFDLSPLVAFFVLQLTERILTILMFDYMG